MADATSPRDPYMGNAFARRAFDSPTDVAESPSVIYYAKHLQHVKIGTTKRLPQRIAELGLTMRDVLAVEFGSYGLETMRHRQFAHLLEPTLGAEHFRLGADLKAHIIALKSSMLERME